MGWKFWEREKSAAEQSLEDLQERRPAAPMTQPAAQPVPASAPATGFRMPVEDVFSITGRGTVVTGRVESGTVSVGQSVTLQRTDGSERTLEVTGVEMFRKTVEVASLGDNVGLLLRGVQRKEIGRGDLLLG